MKRLLLAAMMTLPWSAPASAQHWVTAWAASSQGPYPSGNATAQPELRFALPNQDTGARDQSFRLIVRPTVWGQRVRLRFSNAFGTRPVTFDGAFVGLQASGAALMPGSNRPVLFGGRKQLTVPSGATAWSDPVSLPFVANPAAPELLGRKLALSFHVVGESGPITWHAKALQTSYLTQPGAGALGELEEDSAYPSTATSWFFVDALETQAPSDTKLVVAFGDSITDGTASTLNGDDRWPDALARRLRAAGIRASVVNAGIGGNQVVGPAEYTPAAPFAGGPSALSRLDRDVLGLSGVTHVIWLEGINDIGAGATAEAIEAGLRQGVERLRTKLPAVRVIGATLTSAVGTTAPALQAPDAEARRQAVNRWIRDNPDGLFDGVVDFDAATADPRTKGLREEFVPNSTVGGSGDRLHPNRAGYLAMADAVDLGLIAAGPRPVPHRPQRPAPAKVPGATQH